MERVSEGWKQCIESIYGESVVIGDETIELGSIDFVLTFRDKKRFNLRDILPHDAAVSIRPYSLRKLLQRKTIPAVLAEVELFLEDDETTIDGSLYSFTSFYHKLFNIVDDGSGALDLKSDLLGILKNRSAVLVFLYNNVDDVKIERMVATAIVNLYPENEHSTVYSHEFKICGRQVVCINIDNSMHGWRKDLIHYEVHVKTRDLLQQLLQDAPDEKVKRQIEKRINLINHETKKTRRYKLIR